MTFTQTSGMLKFVNIHKSLLSTLWRSYKYRNFFAKILLLIPVLLYSLVCLFFIIFFTIISVIDIIPYLIGRMANGISGQAEGISRKYLGFSGSLFYPPMVFLLSILILIVVILPKTIGMIDDS